MDAMAFEEKIKYVEENILLNPGLSVKGHCTSPEAMT